MLQLVKKSLYFDLWQRKTCVDRTRPYYDMVERVLRVREK